MVTKIDKVTLNNFLKTWLREVMWQIQNILPSLPQCLWQPQGLQLVKLQDPFYQVVLGDHVTH